MGIVSAKDYFSKVAGLAGAAKALAKGPLGQGALSGAVVGSITAKDGDRMSGALTGAAIGGLSSGIMRPGSTSRNLAKVEKKFNKPAKVTEPPPTPGQA